LLSSLKPISSNWGLVPPSNRRFAIIVVLLAAGFFYGLWTLYQLRFAAGDIYPAYSSLRADPLGSKALYESISQLPGWSAARNYLPLENAPQGNATVLFLGEEPHIFEVSPAERLKAFEALARTGTRVVIAMRPLLRLPAESPSATTVPKETPAILARWGVGFGYIIKTRSEEPGTSGIPKQTALYFKYEGKTIDRVERKFGDGVVVLLANCYPMSNEALATDRDTPLLAAAIGDNRRVIFDEYHLGITESGGVVTLARKYHLEGMAAALLLLLILFIWKNSTSFLPARALDETEAGLNGGVEAKDISAGLANLLRRNVRKKQLMDICLKEWETSQHGGRYFSPVKLERVRNLAQRGGDAAETYRALSKILTERSDR
jgi:hypothetical protein